jgi:D-tyrosyl-tRNA(Tyr) deacylase
MRAVVTRVANASVQIDGVTVGEIGRGFLILLGIAPTDSMAQCQKLCDKILGLRVFEDPNGKMNLGLSEVGGQVLVVSQFTLYGDCRKGRRPSFTGAATPDHAIPLYEAFLQECANHGFPPQHGQFGADMQVSSINDGPVTLILDTDELMDTKGVTP